MIPILLIQWSIPYISMDYVFSVLDQDGKINNNMGWKDTVLVPTGSTVDILVIADNPVVWHMHCHIAEHLGASMETAVKVA